MSLGKSGGRTRELRSDLNDLKCFIPALLHLPYFKDATSPFLFRVDKLSDGLRLLGIGHLCLVLCGVF